MHDDINPAPIQPLLANDFMELADINYRDRDIDYLPQPNEARIPYAPITDEELELYRTMFRLLDERFEKWRRSLNAL